MDDPRDRFGALIRTARQALEPAGPGTSMTQEALAERLGVTQPTVSGWESGAAIPSLGALNGLAEVLELDAAVLLTAAAEASQVAVA